MLVFKRILLGTVALVVAAYVALCAYAYWPGEPERPVAELATADDHFVSVDGVQLRYRTWGDAGPGRPNLVLVHGFANSLQSWRELAPRLAACCHVVALDLPGHGLSDKPADRDYHNGPQASVVVKAAGKLGLERPVYVGHSLGGAIAVHASSLDRGTSGLVLLNPGILTTGVPRIVQLTLPPLPRLAAKQFSSRAFRERLLRASYVHPEIVTPEVMDAVMLGSRTEGYLAGTTSLMRQYREGEELPMLGRVSVPTLVAWGNQDRDRKLSEADDLRRMIPGAELVRFTDAGHYVHEEQPDDVARAIEGWLRRHGLVATPAAAPARADGAT